MYVPEGSFPLSRNLGWHNGVHLEAPQANGGRLPVCAIADGTIIFVQPPLKAHSDPQHGQNYPAFGSNAAWSDNGCIIIEHQTEIGADGTAPTSIKFYSLYMHLSFLMKSFRTGQPIRRKDQLGQTGQVYGRAAQLHFEICCDDVNLRKLIGRTPTWTDPKKPPANNGRTDTVFGNVYYYLPADTPIETGAAMPAKHLRAAPAVNTLGTAQWLEIDYGDGGASPGTFTLTSYTLLGEYGSTRKDHDAEYKLYEEASKRHKSVMAAHPAMASSPSGWYELLRFGRNLGRSAADNDPLPENAAHWRRIKTVDGQEIWADLNAPGVRQFSDADFLPAMGWNCYDDDSHPDDQRCDSDRLKNLLRTAGEQPHPTRSADEKYLMARLSEPEVREKLRRVICKFPSEWNRADILQRQGWIKQEREEFKTNPDNWTRFARHCEAMSFEQLPAAYLNAQWHFHPVEFVHHFRKCGWLDEADLALLYAQTEASTREKYRRAINTASRKYGISSYLRMSHFHGQGTVESANLSLMQEAGDKDDSRRSESEFGHWYGYDQKKEWDAYYETAGPKKRSYSWINGNCGPVDAQKFRGRGFKQLTGLELYAQYYVYRGWLKETEFDKYWWDDPQYGSGKHAPMKKRPPRIDDPHRLAIDEYNCIDSGAFYMTCMRPATIREIDKDEAYSRSTAHPSEQEKKLSYAVTRAINGGSNQAPERLSFTLKNKAILL
jgi:predicted chitinase